VVLTNSIAGTLGLITLPYALIFGLLGVRTLAYAIVPLAFVFMMAPVVVARVSFTAARLLLFTTFPVAISVYAWSFGERAGIHFLYFAACCLPVLVCDLGERRLLAYGIGLPMTTFLASEVTGYALLGPPVVPPAVQDVVRWSIIPTTFFILLTALFYFAVASRRAETRLDARNKAMRLVLDHVDQGLLTIEADGRILPERSAAVERWLGPVPDGASLVEVVSPHDARASAWLRLGLGELRDGLLPPEVVLAQLPRRLVANGRTLDLAYKPIDGADGRLLVVLTDVTAVLEREQGEERQRELAALVTRALSDRGILRAFLRELTGLAARLASGRSAAGGTDALLRDLHTLKGNAALLGIASVARMCHDAETRALDQGELPEAEALAAIAARLAEVTASVWPLLGAEDGPRVGAEDVARLRRLVVVGASSRELLAEIDTWFHEPAEARLSLLGEQARRLAERLGRAPLRAVVEADGVRVEPERFAELWSSLAHVVRNAVDHGLEDVATRVAAGKAEWATLRLSAAVERDELVVRIEDDGRGVDWDAVAERARARGLPVREPSDLVAALFTDGLSTRENADETSGRGVGLAAVKAAAEALGGTVEVDSRPGAGTRFVV
jgi:HPt (histidine-containing phosphotransfer) domain-containing protein/two-component sensor histidine kinase